VPYQEKRAWIYAAVAVLVPVAYTAVLIARAPADGIAAGRYVVPMLIAVGASIALNILAVAVVAGAAPKEATAGDERDRAIGQRGDHVAFYVLSIAALVPLVLAMREAPYFWIANSLYLAFALAALVSSVVKIVAYRRGM
jgi:predicted membrane channel-forming protein YqfA (hemolysin III family)